MKLEDAKQITIRLQETLDLYHDTVPESEFLVETHFLATYFSKDVKKICIHSAQEETFRPGGAKEKIPCVSVTIESPGETTLKFVYYDGDNAFAGPHHALAIVQRPSSHILYWRKRGQDPQTEWHYNILARGQIGFIFTQNYAGAEFMPKQAYREFLHEYGVSDFIGFKDDAAFLAEIAYLGCWNLYNSNAPLEEGIDFSPAFDYVNHQATIAISCDKRGNIEPVFITYQASSIPGKLSVTILDGVSKVYERKAEQDEVTEWVQNCMANDPKIDDGYGHPLFISETIQE